MDGKSVQYQNIKKAVALLAKIRVCEAAIYVLAKRRKQKAESLEKILKSYGIRLSDDKTKNMLIIQAKIDNFVREYNTLLETETEKDKDKKTTINQYIDLVTMISSHFKLHLDIMTITVSSFCSYYKQYLKELESLKKINRKNSGKLH